MADEEFDSPDVILDLLGEGQCIADEARKALPQSVVEALDVVGFAGFLRNSFVTLGWNDPGVGVILIRIEGGLFPVHRWDMRPQRFGTVATPLTDVKCNDLAGRRVHRDPDPVLIGFLFHKAPHLIGFGF